MTKIKIVQLNKEEEKALKDIYSVKECPKKCHTSERRIWYIPRELVEIESNFNYTCCISCYYKKSNLNLLNNKYTFDSLVPVLCENLPMNCDESCNENDVSVIIDDNFLLAIYVENRNKGFQNIEKISSTSYNIYLNTISGNFNVVLYKLLNNIGQEQFPYTLYSSLHYDNVVDTDINDNLIVYNKAFSYNDEICCTLNKILTVNNTPTQKTIKTNLLKYNFYNKSKETIILNYFTNTNINSKNSIKLNLIYTKSNYDQKIINNAYIGFYNNKELII